MAGLRDLLPTVATVLAAQYTIASPTTSLSDVRIYGSNDATHGAIGWTPELNGGPFCVLYAEEVLDAQPEPNRVWANYKLCFFVGVEHADTPAVAENYNDLALAWMDQARQVVAANRRLYPASGALWPVAGDAQWDFKSAKIESKFPVYGVPFYGVYCTTSVRLVISVSYQL